MEYVEFQYRREMHLTPQELDDMPAEVFNRDLQFMATEEKARKWLED